MKRRRYYLVKNGQAVGIFAAQNDWGHGVFYLLPESIDVVFNRSCVNILYGSLEDEKCLIPLFKEMKKKEIFTIINGTASRNFLTLGLLLVSQRSLAP